jgi:hypothetical protein
MAQYLFGSGTLILKSIVANTQQAQLGVLQDTSLDFDRKIEFLMGQYNFPVAAGGGEMSIKGKAKYARLQSTQFSNMFLGSNATVTTPAMLQMNSTGESGTVASAAVTVANGATFAEDLGVYTLAGVQLQPVASSPAAGVSYVPGVAGIGTYTFNASDNATVYLFFYSYTVTTAGTSKIAIANALTGPVPTFEVFLKETFNNQGVVKDLVLKLNACVAPKLSLPFANTKFTVAEMDFQAIADANNNIGTWSMTE